MYRPSLANALIDCDDRKAVLELTDKVKVTKSLENVLLARLREGDVNALIGALRLLEDGNHDHQKAVRHCLQLIWDSTSEEDERARRQLHDRLPQDWRPRLAEFEKTVNRGRVARDLTRGARNLFDRGRGSDVMPVIIVIILIIVGLIALFYIAWILLALLIRAFSILIFYWMIGFSLALVVGLLYSVVIPWRVLSKRGKYGFLQLAPDHVVAGKALWGARPRGESRHYGWDRAWPMYSALPGLRGRPRRGRRDLAHARHPERVGVPQDQVRAVERQGGQAGGRAGGRDGPQGVLDRPAADPVRRLLDRRLGFRGHLAGGHVRARLGDLARPAADAPRTALGGHPLPPAEQRGAAVPALLPREPEAELSLPEPGVHRHPPQHAAGSAGPDHPALRLWDPAAQHDPVGGSAADHRLSLLRPRARRGQRTAAHRPAPDHRQRRRR